MAHTQIGSGEFDTLACVHMKAKPCDRLSVGSIVHCWLAVEPADILPLIGHLEDDNAAPPFEEKLAEGWQPVDRLGARVDVPQYAIMVGNGQPQRDHTPALLGGIPEYGWQLPTDT